MGKKLEDKILDEIKKRVVEKDEFLRKKDDRGEETAATLDALADITSLNREEVDEIARSVRVEMDKRRNRKNLSIVLGSLVVLSVVIWALVTLVFRPPKVSIVETFDGPDRGWAVGRIFDYAREFKDGEYVYRNAKDGWCTWDAYDFDFPSGYSVELTSVWRSGQYGQYGLMVLGDDDNYYSFDLRGDGKANYSIVEKGKLLESSPLVSDRGHQGDGRTPNVQRLDVSQDRFKYFINDKDVAEGDLSRIEAESFAVEVCGEQTVAFKHLVIKPLGGLEGPVVETFDGPGLGWPEERDVNYQREFKDGVYLYRNNREDWCTWDDYEIQLPDEYSVELTTVWKTGKYDKYSLLLLEDDDNYYAFNLQGDGQANYSLMKDDKWVHTSDWTSLGGEQGRSLQKLDVSFGKFKYYVDGKLIQEGELSEIDIKELGLRVCGLQTVAFEHLEVKPLGRDGPPLFVETFDKVSTGWNPRFKLQKEKRFENGQYLFTANKADYCYWSTVPIDIIGDFELVLSSVWRKGETADFGVMLTTDDKNYYVFEVRNDGAARFGRVVDGKTVQREKRVKISEAGPEVDRKVQKVRVAGGRFEYFLNDRPVGQWDFESLDIRQVGVRVCDRQTVAFDHLEIIPLGETKGALFTETFDQPSGDWLPRVDLLKEQRFDDGRYVFTSNKKDWCYWSSIPIEIEGQFEVTLSSTWQKGETENYGLMIMDDDNNYYVFEIQNNGQARIGRVVDGEWSYTGDWKTVQGAGIQVKNKTQKVKVGKRKLMYYLNGQFVADYKIEDRNFNQVGVRVCDRQSVAFDSLTIESK